MFYIWLTVYRIRSIGEHTVGKKTSHEANKTFTEPLKHTSKVSTVVGCENIVYLNDLSIVHKQTTVPATTS
jgi:hypothetical protein